MERSEIKKAIAEQIVNMIDNDIIAEYGTESFIGWLEDGEVFVLNGYTGGEVAEIMAEVRKVADAVDAMVFSLERIDMD